jgi:signal transduction histidine kinase
MVSATLLATAALGYLNVRRLYAYDRLIDQTHQVTSELRYLLGLVADAESAMRGYVLTPEADHLRPYELAKAEFPGALARLARLTAGDRQQLTAAGELARHVERRMQLMARTIEARADEGWQLAQLESTEQEGRAVMQRIHNLVDSMQRDEEVMLTRRISEANLGYWTALASSLISAVIGLALAVVGFRLADRSFKERERRARELEASNDQLEERVRERTAQISQANAALHDEIAERERAEHNARLMAEELQRSNRDLAQFAAIASHDLHEPLRKIQAFGDRLLGQCSDELSDRAREYLNRLLESTERMRQLIDGLLEYSRASTRSEPRVAVDLGQVAREVVSDLEPRVQATSGQVHIEELPTIAADPLQMRQLLQNLIGNALKFQRPNVPPVVRVAARVAPGAGAKNGKSSATALCELTVEDNGVGFDVADAERIFELFHRLHGRDEYEGTGMGLAICKKIAERHGGSITATSIPGQGSRFLVKLPLSASEKMAKDGMTE